MISMDIISSFELKCTIFLLFSYTFYLLMMNNRKKLSETAISVNYHFTRQCNYQCKFCFHTAKTSFVLPLEEAKRGLKKLHDAGMKAHSDGKHGKSEELLNKALDLFKS